MRGLPTSFRCPSRGNARRLALDRGGAVWSREGEVGAAVDPDMTVRSFLGRSEARRCGSGHEEMGSVLKRDALAAGFGKR